MKVLPKQHGYPLYFKGDFIFNYCFTLYSDELRIYRLLKPATASQTHRQTRKSLKQILKCKVPPIVEVLVEMHSKLEILTAWFINLLTPNVDYSGRTAPLTSKCCIL